MSVNQPRPDAVLLPHPAATAVVPHSHFSMHYASAPSTVHPAFLLHPLLPQYLKAAVDPPVDFPADSPFAAQLVVLVQQQPEQPDIVPLLLVMIVQEECRLCLVFS